MRVLARRPTLASGIDVVFLRLNPAEFHAHISARSLVPAAAVDLDALERARLIFDRFAPLSFGADLREIGQRGWSFLPAAGNLVIDMKTSKYGWLTYAREP